MTRTLLLLGIVVLCPMASRTTAGTTGSLNGTVTDRELHAPIAGAIVFAVSPSQISHVITDAKGRYVFISLAPDTYTVTAERISYDPIPVSGVYIETDQQLSVDLKITRLL